MSALFLDAHEVAAALNFPQLIDFMAAALAHPIAAPLRLCITGTQQRELLVMPVMSEHLAGVKVLAVTPQNSGSELPVVGGLFVLLDAQTGAALATMDAGELTARRTAAVSALASRQLSRPDAETLLVIGTGHIAPYLAEAHCSVRPIRRIQVWGRRAQATRHCADLIQQRVPGVAVEIADDLAVAVAGNDIISAATRAQEPLIKGECIRAGTHLDLIGGYRPDMREIDDYGIAHATIYVDTIEGALAEAGDLRSPIARGIISENSIVGDIAAIVRGAGRTSEAEITLFKSVGTAMSDLAAADLVWRTHNG